MLSLQYTILVLSGCNPSPTSSIRHRERRQHLTGLPLADAVHDHVIGVALEFDSRELPGHPHIERVVHEQVRQERRNR